MCFCVCSFHFVYSAKLDLSLAILFDLFICRFFWFFRVFFILCVCLFSRFYVWFFLLLSEYFICWFLFDEKLNFFKLITIFFSSHPQRIYVSLTYFTFLLHFIPFLAESQYFPGGVFVNQSYPLGSSYIKNILGHSLSKKILFVFVSCFCSFLCVSIPSGKIEWGSWEHCFQFTILTL